MILSQGEAALALALDAAAPPPSPEAVDAAHLAVAKARRESASEGDSAA